MSAVLVVLTGPIAAGKNTVAGRLGAQLGAAGRSVVICDLDDVVAQAVATGRGDADPWPAARRAHAALVAAWTAGPEPGDGFEHGLGDGFGDMVIAVGPFLVADDHRVLRSALPAGTRVVTVLLDAPVAVTWARVQDDPGRDLSRQHGFHHTAHARYLGLRATIPADLVLDASSTDPDTLAASIASELTRL